MLNDLSFFMNDEKQNKSVYDAKELFGENRPYEIERTIEGRVVLFNEHFIRTAREAMSTGCMAKMNMAETNLWIRFVEYQDGKTFRDITDQNDRVLDSLNEYMVDEVHLLHHSVVNGCYDRPTHTWYQQ